MSQFRNPIFYPNQKAIYSSSDLDRSIIDQYPVVQTCNISSIGIVKVDHVQKEGVPHVHVKFSVRMSNNDSFTVSLGTIPDRYENKATTFLNHARLQLIGMMSKSCCVVFCRGGLV